ncbi:MAG: DGQHR domain-containing protein [Chloroflexota bacterium]|nr:DGQHR domain-containing protein [Chloroflexota bacterium]
MDEDVALSANEWITLRCLQITQPIGTFYVAVAPFRKIVTITYSDVRRIEHEKREVETYLGIERPLSPRRVADLRDYVRTVDASFPSSIILAVEPHNARYEADSGVIHLRNYMDVGKILDGQHRIAGLADFAGDFDVIVAIFVDMDIEEQALVFATINLEQTKVNKSLTYDLYDYAKQRSPQKTAHNVVRLLDQANESPFRGKIKILGTASESQETISQAAFVDTLLPLLSPNPNKDRDDLKRGKSLSPAIAGEEQRLIFRNMFIAGRDSDIARVLFSYFKAVQLKWGPYWDEPRPGSILNRTTGFRALMGFLPFAYLYLTQPGGVPTLEAFSTLFRRVKLEGRDLTPENYPPGTGGQTRLRDQLRSQSGL